MGDMAMRKDWQRLADRVRARRVELDMTQEDVRAKDGPSTATMRLIEGSLQERYQPFVLARLEKALGWSPGSVRAILDGGEPTLVEDKRPQLHVIEDRQQDDEDDRFAHAEALLAEAMKEIRRLRQQRGA